MNSLSLLSINFWSYIQRVHFDILGSIESKVGYNCDIRWLYVANVTVNRFFFGNEKCREGNAALSLLF